MAGFFRGHSPVGAGGHNLPERFGAHIAGHKEAGIGGPAVLPRQKEACCICGELALQRRGVRLHADCLLYTSLLVCLLPVLFGAELIWYAMPITELAVALLVAVWIRNCQRTLTH